MKLFIVASLIAVASAARLEHLERSYLPPDQGSNQGRYGAASVGSLPSSSSFGSFGSGSHGGFGGHSGSGHFGGSSSFDSNGIETQAAGVRSGSSFPGATINQYLPPDHGPSGSNGFSGSQQGFGNQRSSQYSPQSSFGSASQYSPQSSFGSASQYSPQSSFGSASQYSAPSSQYGTPSNFGAQSRYQGAQQFGSQGLGAQGQGNQALLNQFPSASRQYLAPQASSSNYPQQAFDEQTGYHY